MKPVSLEVTMMKIIGELKADLRNCYTAIRVKDDEKARLKAEVERMTKAGDAFISVGVKMREMIGDHHWTLEFDRVRTDWSHAAKEGNAK